MWFTKKLGAALYDFVMTRPEKAGLQQWRRQLLASAGSTVVEIGAGTGANLGLYPEHVERLIAVEPNAAMAQRMALDTFSGRGDAEILEAVVGDLPLADDSVDTVVTTLVLCSVPDVAQGLAELRRVLRPEGKLLFMEHVASCDQGLRKWQDRVDPLWYGLNGDCHLNRRTESALEDAGFEIIDCKRDRMPRAPAVLAPTIRGVAVLAGGENQQR